VAGQGGALPAARILAAAERLREDVGSPPAPNERPGFDRRIAAVQEAIGDEGAFARAWAEGRAMSLEQAIDLALDTAVQPTTNADGWTSCEGPIGCLCSFGLDLRDWESPNP